MRRWYGRGGWVYFDGIGLPGPLRLRFDDDGELVDLYLAADTEPITPGHLRTLPLGRLVALARAREELFNAAARRAVLGLEEGDVPDLRALLADVFPARPRTHLDRDARLSPPTEGLTDAFLAQVGRAYNSAVTNGERPNKALAEQVGHDTTRTVERWVYLARKAGHLPPTRPGGIS